ncbi:MAG: radical SAM family heme chaperone HemW [Pseudomonadota bacterium]
MADADAGFGVYIHWPFCAAKCPYCDFNSHVRDGVDQDRWAEALCTELGHVASQSDPQTLRSVFFGGGTPSLMDPKTVARVLDTAHELWPSDGSVEVTIEGNPTSVEAGRFAGYAAAGVNRVSLGVQALNDTDLRALGRMHTAQEAKEAIGLAHRYFDRVSFDLIYARQRQTLQEWCSELKQALSLAADHMSLYQLTIEPGTAFGARFEAGRLKGLPGDDLAADLYEATQQICETAGLPAYEVSNHAVTGAESQHNLIYWRGGLFVGVGPGAHGRVSRDGVVYATRATASPEEWLGERDTQPGSTTAWERVPDQERATEYLMMALRLSEGASLSTYEGLAGSGISTDVIDSLSRDGFIDHTGDRIVASAKGRVVLNALLRELLLADA